MLSTTQKYQELQYSFPYHHLVGYESGTIALTRYWGWALNYLGRLELIHRALREVPFENLLDVGCGDGKLLTVLSSEFGDRQFHGVDYSQQAIDLAVAICKSENVTFRMEDVVTAEKTEKYDVVTLIEVVEHIPPQQLNTFLASVVSKYVASHGHVIITTPSNHLPRPQKHYQHFSVESLDRALRQVGLEVVYLDAIDGDSAAFSMIKKLFLNRVYCVTSRKLQNVLFAIYKKLCLSNQGARGNGIFVVARHAKI